MCKHLVDPCSKLYERILTACGNGPRLVPKEMGTHALLRECAKRLSNVSWEYLLNKFM